jgi:hypothetical protein
MAGISSTPPMGRLSAYERRWVLLMGLGLLAAIAIGMLLRPYDDDGQPLAMETHRQLGLPQCHFVALTGKPCPACGMTTSVSLLYHGDLRHSVGANWVGTILAMSWLALVPWSILVAWRGRYWGIRSLERASYWYVGFFLAALLMRWGVVMWQYRNL